MLNLPGHHSTAAIVAEIENTVVTGEEYPDACFQISDCNRSISLDFESLHRYYDDPREDVMANDIHKIDVMLDALKAFRKGLLVEHERIRARERNKT